jgi:hypothetical protein
MHYALILRQFSFETLIAVLTGAVCRASKRSLIGWCAVSGQVPCSGAKRRDKVLDEVSTAILGDAVAENKGFTRNRIT